MKLLIGDIARQTNCQVETIRYYEQEGLLPPTERTVGNYRIYSQVHLERLRFIRNCRSLDMTLGEVRQLLSITDQPESRCGSVSQILDEHIVHVKKRISDLRRLAKQLQAIRGQCDDGRASRDCVILSELTHHNTEVILRRQPSHPTGTHCKGG